jgi:LacI family transcriptional regulator
LLIGKVTGRWLTMPDRPFHASHRTIAQEAGVSAVTVSLALRNHPRIPETTRQKIRRIADAQGYKSDPQVTKLMDHLRMRRRRNLCSNLAALRLEPSIKPRHGAHLLEGVQKRADLLGYALDVFDLKDPNLNPDRLGKILRSRGVEGLILLPMPPTDLSRLLNWSAFSVVATSHSILQPRFNTVVPNQFSNMMRLCARLAEAKEARIGIATAVNYDLRVNHRFTSAYLWHAMMRGGAPIRPLFLQDGPLDVRALRNWIERNDIEVVMTEYTLMNSIKTLLPDHFLNKVKWVYTWLPPNTVHESGIRENPEKIGTAAVDLLAAMIQRGERGIPDSPCCMEIEGSIVYR